VRFAAIEVSENIWTHIYTYNAGDQQSVGVPEIRGVGANLLSAESFTAQVEVCGANGVYRLHGMKKTDQPLWITVPPETMHTKQTHRSPPTECQSLESWATAET
jgi:hypothetical protein